MGSGNTKSLKTSQLFSNQIYILSNCKRKMIYASHANSIEDMLRILDIMFSTNELLLKIIEENATYLSKICNLSIVKEQCHQLSNNIINFQFDITNKSEILQINVRKICECVEMLEIYVFDNVKE